MTKKYILKEKKDNIYIYIYNAHGTSELCLICDRTLLTLLYIYISGGQSHITDGV